MLYLSEKDNLCLYGFPSGHWEVNLPAEEVPPELPEPALGINFARDGMQEKDWISLVAVHSDAWLLAVAFYFGARFGFDKAERKQLFTMINDLPTIFETVNETKKVKEKTSVSNHSSNKTKPNSQVVSLSICSFLFIIFFSFQKEISFSIFTKLLSCLTLTLLIHFLQYFVLQEFFNNSTLYTSLLILLWLRKRVQESQVKRSKPVQPKDDDDDLDDEDEDEHGETLCGACGENYASDEFWICCDICEKWFHGKCVKITPARAEHIKQYKCPSCSNKRPRP
ncbi:hypothetical protein GIB67_002364 [Kingdonia uniflora]|uniref:PHD finger protein ALFIN-LIKE n=1 Tax=Kingdonia uniflora TaxID=39325 RepID=A0A7J7M8E5_9MAGN|nr:hypothetical protein GIB67_002364 [Kingdonia uniflora]